MSDAPALPDYGAFARMLYGTFVISDPWLAGAERFRLQPVLLTPDQATDLYLVAERIGYLFHELAQIVGTHEELLDEFYGLTPFQKAMWLAAEGQWHGIARIDLFICTDGRIRSCEMNSDTPSGEAEATILNSLLHPWFPSTVDPNTQFEKRFWELLVHSLEADRGQGAVPKTIAIVYPTDLPEDLSMIAVYTRWLEKRGCEVVIGSPYNLSLDGAGRVLVMGRPVDLIIRHYKTDWWGERELIWTNQQPFPDADPLERELMLLLGAVHKGLVTVVNPFGAVVTQNKLSMALMWERQELFSDQAREWIREYVPETLRLSVLNPDSLEREDWVLKSNYGCEGDSVIVGRFTKQQDWQMAVATLIPRHWVAQRYFDVKPHDGLLPNYGVYLIGGEAAGIYTRVSEKSTDYTAVTAATFVAESQESLTNTNAGASEP